MGALQEAVNSDRFRIIGRLGEGGMGVVYRALDLVLGTEVAVKHLSRAGGRDLYRFKREFRALAEVSHPNLVRLHELFVQGDQWLFSMELVDGVPLGRFLRPPAPAPAPAPALPPGVLFDEHPAGDAAADDPTTETSRAPAVAVPTVDLDRLRATFAQLADAVMAIHALGKLHRDLKPSNVLVQPDGRVVVLDFGLVRDAEPDVIDRTHEAMAVGTPAYMSPEQARDLPLDPASDWYAVGVMLFESLTGARPFPGTPAESMVRRTQQDPLRPRQVDPSLPDELDRICTALLAREPGDRADGRALLAALGAAPSPATLAIERLAAPTPFIGRERELAALRAAFAEAEDGACVFAPITGPSGIGKTSLVRQFLDALDPADALVFQARCYERESVPFQAIDSLVDAVATRMMSMAPATLEAALPRNIGALARLFPSLHRVPQIAAPRIPSLLPRDHVELRRRAVAAFGELLANLAGPATLVVFLDDLQWSDADAGAVLAELVRSFEDTGALFVIATRGGVTMPGAMLPAERGLPTVRLDAERGKRTEPSAPSGLVLRELALGPLPEREARALVAAIAPGDLPRTVDDIADEAAGVPFFVAELARAGDAPGSGRRSLERVLGDRIDRLAPDARALLDACAVATRPLRLEVAAAVAGGDVARALAELRTERLIHTARRGDHHLVEPVHDRVRAAVTAALGDDRRRAINARLAAALEAGDDTEAADLVTYWLAAGDRARAAHHARAAGRAADDAVAFHRAAELYTLALEDPALGPDDRRELRVAMAQCLAAVGRLEPALAALELALADATGATYRAIKRLAVAYVLRVGDFDRGIAEVNTLCRELGFRMPRSRGGILRAIVGNELMLRVRGTGFTPRDEAEVPPLELEKLDTLWQLTTALAYTRPVFGRLVQLYQMRAALAVGEPTRVARALSLEPGHAAQAGVGALDKVKALEERARTLIEQHDRDELRGLFHTSCAVSCAITGRWREASDHARTGERHLRDHLRGMRWPLNIAQMYRVFSSWYLGDIAAVVRLVPQFIEEGEELGDALGLGLMRVGRGNVYWLVIDRPAEAAAMIETGFARGDNGSDFHLHDYFHDVAQVHHALYVGEAGRALELGAALQDRMARSLMRRVQFLRIDVLQHVARAAAAAAVAASGEARARLVREARRLLERADRERAGWAESMSLTTRAALAGLDGRDDEAIALATRAVDSAEAGELALFAQAARWRRGELRGGDAGAAEVEAAMAWMRERKVVNPAALMRMLAAPVRSS